MQKRRAREHFLKAIKLGGLEYSEDRTTSVSLTAEDSLVEAKKSLESAYAKFPSAEWIANLSGGTKPMSIAMYEFFKALGGRLIYTNVATPATFIDLGNDSKESGSHRPTIHEFLAGYGFKLGKDENTVSEAEKRAKQFEVAAKRAALNASNLDLVEITDGKQRSDARSKGMELRTELIREVFHPEEFPLGNRKYDKYEMRFLTGDWLEIFIWGILDKHKTSLGIWDVRWGLEIQDESSDIKNEFDVTFMHNYGLCMIECKSGDQEHDRNGEILYKVQTVTHQFRALRVRSYLVTTGSNVLDPKTKAVKLTLRDRAKLYGCQILTSDNIRALAKDYENVEVVRTILFGSHET